MKKLLLSILAISLLASCNGDKVKQEEGKNPESKTKVESSTETKKEEKVEDKKEEEKVVTDDETETKKEETTTDSAEKTYEGDKFSFVYPNDWKLAESKGIVQVLSPLDEGDLFAENVNIIAQDIKALGVDYDKFIKSNVKNIKDMLVKNSGKIISEEDVKVSGIDAKKYVYEFTMQNTGIKTTQYFMNKDEKAYIITFTNSQSAPDEKKEEFAKILESVKIK